MVFNFPFSCDTHLLREDEFPLQFVHFVHHMHQGALGLLPAIFTHSMMRLLATVHDAVGGGEVLRDGDLLVQSLVTTCRGQCGTHFNDRYTSTATTTTTSGVVQHERLSWQLTVPLVSIGADQQQTSIQRRNDGLGDVIIGVYFEALVRQQLLRAAHQTDERHERRPVDYHVRHPLALSRFTPRIGQLPFPATIQRVLMGGRRKAYRCDRDLPGLPHQF